MPKHKPMKDLESSKAGKFHQNISSQITNFQATDQIKYSNMPFQELRTNSLKPNKHWFSNTSKI